jgi:hypothetical protein
MIRAVFVALLFSLSACTSQLGPPAIYPEAELAPGQILTPIRDAMGPMTFTNAELVRDDTMNVEGYRADGAYRFTVVRQDDRWVLANTERTGPAPR